MAEKQQAYPIQTEAITEFTTPVIKLILALIGLFVIQFIFVNLPGLDTTFPNTTLTIATVANGIITLIMAVIIVNFAREVEPRVRRVISGPEDVVYDIANAINFVIVFIAILIVYDGLNDVAVPALVSPSDAWMYDMLFLGIALIPTVIVAYRIFDNLDEMARLLTSQIQSLSDTSQVTCINCGASVDDSLEYCPDCGTTLPDEAQTETEMDSETEAESGVEEPELLECPECEDEVSDSMAFCGQCGAELSQ